MLIFQNPLGKQLPPEVSKLSVIEEVDEQPAEISGVNLLPLETSELVLHPESHLMYLNLLIQSQYGQQVCSNHIKKKTFIVHNDEL